MLQLSNLARKNYWLGQPDVPGAAAFWLPAVILFAMIYLGIVLLFFSRKIEEKAVRLLLSRLSALLLSLGLAGLLLFSFRQGLVPVLDWRIWWLAWLAALLWRGGKLAWYGLARLPKIRRENAERLEKEKYLPGKK